MSPRPKKAKIVGQIRRPWVSVPIDLIEDRRLTPTARLVLVYMIGLVSRPDWTLYVTQVQGAIGIGEDAWRHARKVLERYGYYRAERQQQADGKWCWTHVVSDEPATPDGDQAPTDSRARTIPGKPKDGSSGDGSTGHGSAIHGSPGDIRTNKEHKKKTCTTTTADQRHAKLILPPSLTSREVVVVEELVNSLPAGMAQEVVDELAGAMAKKGTIRSSRVSYLGALVDRAHAGEFHPSLGIEVAAARERRAAENQRLIEERAERKRREASAAERSEVARAHLAGISQRLGVSLPPRSSEDHDEDDEPSQGAS